MAAVSDDFRALIGPDTWSGMGMSMRRWRDLLLIDLGDRTLVVAADSNAGIGAKPGDFLAQEPFLTGYSAAKVPLMEVVATGATPFLVIDNLCVELRPTGLEILRGIRSVIDDAGLEVLITGSDEANMPTRQTGVGVTVLGSAASGELRIGRTQPGDDIWVLGRRASGLPGDEYEAKGEGIARLGDLVAVEQLPGVHELLPVGSHGIGHESAELVSGSGLALAPVGTSVDLTASAGASTCFLVSCEPGASEGLAAAGLPMELLGTAVTFDEQKDKR
ncbi:MAG: hypothetical protein KF680_02550 [Cryobacterium sp.]|nr:hypothetical protein [Cryobacterium sp.]